METTVMNTREYETQNESFTAMICERAALFGATPGPDEFDNRPLREEDEATAADRLIPGIRELQREQDGSELRSRELELATDRAQNLNNRRDAFEQMRDAAAEAYRTETGEVWRPRRGSHVSQTGKLTSAVIEARDFQRARKDRANTAHLPPGNPRRRRAREGGERLRPHHRPPRQAQGQVRRRRPRPRRRDGPSATASTRSSASPTGMPTAGPLPSAGTTSSSHSSPRA